MREQGHTLTDLERVALEAGHARLYRGRVIPIIRGAEGDDETEEEKAARERAEADARNKTFTQEDVDRIVQERIARVKATPPADYDELKAKAAKLEEIEAANLTELEKERDRAAKAEERATKIEAEAKETRLRAAIIAEAAKPGRNVVDTNDVIALLDRSGLELDDDGNPTNIAKAMDSLLEAKPHLVAAANGGSRGDADQGARGGGGSQIGRDALKDMQPDEIRTALREGKLDTVLKGGS